MWYKWVTFILKQHLFVAELPSLVLAVRAMDEGIGKTGCTFSLPKVCQNRSVKGITALTPNYHRLTLKQANVINCENSALH